MTFWLIEDRGIGKIVWSQQVLNRGPYDQKSYALPPEPPSKDSLVLFDASKIHCSSILCSNGRKRLNHFSSSVFLQNRFRFVWVVIEPIRYRCFWSENVIPYPTTLETIRPQSTLAPSRSQKVFFLIPFKATPAATAPIPRRRWLPFPGLEGGPLCHSTTQNPFLFSGWKASRKKCFNLCSKGDNYL